MHLRGESLPEMSDSPVNWFRIITELDQAGVNNSEVGRRLGRAASTVFRWKMGREPGYEDGKRLLEIHAYVMASFAQRQSESA